MAVNLSIFTAPPVACKEIYSAGSKLLVSYVDNCAEQPTEYELTLTAAVAPGDTEVTVDLTAPAEATEVFVRRGSFLNFPAESYKVLVDTLVEAGTPATIPIETAAVIGSALGDATTIWGLNQLLSITNLPLNLETQTEDRTDLEAFQTSMVTTNVGAKSSIATIARPDDAGFWKYIYTGVQNGRDVWVTAVLADGWLIAGRVKVMNLNTDGNINTIRKPTFDIQFQSKYASPTYFDYLTTEQKVEFNKIRALSGLSTLVTTP